MVTGTLANIIEEVAKAKLTSPAIIIVGKVVTLRDTLSWFEQKPLFGKRILVTRAREQASVLSEKLEALGAEAWEYPTIEIKEPGGQHSFRSGNCRSRHLRLDDFHQRKWC